MAKKKTDTELAAPLTLRDVADDFRSWSDTIEGIEDPLEREKAIQAFTVSMIAGREKVDRFAGLLRRFEAEAGFQRAEAKLHQRRAEILDNAVERMKDYARAAILDAGGAPVEGSLAKLQVIPSPAKVIIFDESKVPSEFKTMTITVSAENWESFLESASVAFGDVMNPDGVVAVIGITKADVSISKTAVKKAIDAGREVPGADVDMSGNYLKVTP